VKQIKVVYTVPDDKVATELDQIAARSNRIGGDIDLVSLKVTSIVEFKFADRND
jgi:hypothetical protein